MSSVAVSGSANGVAPNSNTSSVSYNVTVPGGSNCLVVATGSDGTGASGDGSAPNSVTFNGVALTQVSGGSVIGGWGGTMESTLWYLLNPPTGTAYALDVAYPDTKQFIAVDAVALTNVSSLGTAVTFDSGQTQPSSGSVTASGAGSSDLYVATSFLGGGSGTVIGAGTNQTELNTVTARSSRTETLDTIPGADAGAFSWTYNSSSKPYGALGVAVAFLAANPVAVSGSASGTAPSSNSSSVSYNVTVPSGANCLVVATGSDGTGASGDGSAPSSVTFNSVALTKVSGASVIGGWGGTMESSLWYLLNPPTTSAYSVDVIYPDAKQFMAVDAVALMNVSSVGSGATFDSGQTQPSSGSVTASGAGSSDLYVATSFLGGGSGTVTGVGTNQTELNTVIARSSRTETLDTIPGADAGAFSWTYNSSSKPYGALGGVVAFMASGGGGALIISTSSLPNAIVGSSYNNALAATGGSGSGYMWSLVSATPNADLWIDVLTNSDGTGQVKGTPQVSETESLTVQVEDSSGNTAQATFSITVSD